MPGRSFVHIEIPAANREASSRFYGEMFGWEFKHFTEPTPYTTFATGNVDGGFPNIGEQTKAGDVLVYIDSEDIDADLKKIEKLGGKTLSPKMDIPGYGTFAVFVDPAGNHLALFKGIPG